MTLVAGGRVGGAWFDAECRLGLGARRLPGATATAEELVSTLAANGIDRALVTHAAAVGYDPVEGNRRLMREIRGHPELEPSWVLLPDHTGEFPAPGTVVSQMVAQGVRAARILPCGFRFAFRLWNVGHLISALAERRIPLWVDFGHDGWSEEAIDYEGLHEICGAFPKLPVVLVRAHIGSDRRVRALMAQHANLHVETSYYTVHRGIESLCSAVGPERVLFGSGLPRRDPGPAITALAYSLIGEDAMTLVAGGNLQRLLGGVHTSV